MELHLSLPQKQMFVISVKAKEMQKHHLQIIILFGCFFYVKLFISTKP